MKLMRNQRGGISESSTTSDNTTDFIEIVKKHDIVYNTHHPDYKNVEAKLKIWTLIAEEIGLSVGMYYKIGLNYATNCIQYVMQPTNRPTPLLSTSSQHHCHHHQSQICFSFLFFLIKREIFSK